MTQVPCLEGVTMCPPGPQTALRGLVGVQQCRMEGYKIFVAQGALVMPLPKAVLKNVK